jgi:hypothetical protein
MYACALVSAGHSSENICTGGGLRRLARACVSVCVCASVCPRRPSFRVRSDAQIGCVKSHARLLGISRTRDRERERESERERERPGKGEWKKSRGASVPRGGNTPTNAQNLTGSTDSN